VPTISPTIYISGDNASIYILRTISERVRFVENAVFCSRAQPRLPLLGTHPDSLVCPRSNRASLVVPAVPAGLPTGGGIHRRTARAWSSVRMPTSPISLIFVARGNRRVR